VLSETQAVIEAYAIPATSHALYLSVFVLNLKQMKRPVIDSPHIGMSSELVNLSRKL